MLDLTRNPTPNRTAVSEAWPLVQHGNHDVFTTFYTDIQLENTMLNRMKDSEKVDDFQECYLGYVPGTNRFVMGYDAWHYSDNGDTSGYVMFDLILNDATGHVTVGTMTIAMYDEIFYSAGLNAVREKNPGILDIRLD